MGGGHASSIQVKGERGRFKKKKKGRQKKVRARQQDPRRRGTLTFLALKKGKGSRDTSRMKRGKQGAPATLSQERTYITLLTDWGRESDSLLQREEKKMCID